MTQGCSFQFQCILQTQLHCLSLFKELQKQIGRKDKRKDTFALDVTDDCLDIDSQSHPSASPHEGGLVFRRVTIANLISCKMN